MSLLNVILRDKNNFIFDEDVVEVKKKGDLTLWKFLLRIQLPHYQLLFIKHSLTKEKPECVGDITGYILSSIWPMEGFNAGWKYPANEHAIVINNSLFFAEESYWYVERKNPLLRKPDKWNQDLLTLTATDLKNFIKRFELGVVFIDEYIQALMGTEDVDSLAYDIIAEELSE